RKVTAQRAENNQKNYKKDNFYIISIEIVFFHLSRYFMSRTLFLFENRIKSIIDFIWRIAFKSLMACFNHIF
ncbi:hypothetical protein, partial [Staphylococcus hominis]|uniref:hypothetical protein n=1 Tax=Staphylococcus hominis TaxID=1290 RepID=UPI001E5DBDF2